VLQLQPSYDATAIRAERTAVPLSWHAWSCGEFRHAAPSAPQRAVACSATAPYGCHGTIGSYSSHAMPCVACADGSDRIGHCVVSSTKSAEYGLMPDTADETFPASLSQTVAKSLGFG
jgi:hypothetical protein